MKKTKNFIQFSASDLVNYLGCKHLTQLDRQLVTGEINPPDWQNPALAFLQEKGIEHENAYISHLKTQGLSVLELDGNSTKATIDAIRQGYDIITQARFQKDGYVGIADILRKIDGKSEMGDYHYEIEDTKLAHETKAGTVLQLCLYSELIGEIQGRNPEKMYVVKPGDDFPTDTFRFAEFEAYYNLVKSQFQNVMGKEPVPTYPLPVAKCDTCRWWKECNQKWHNDDHLSLVAGIRTPQIVELNKQGIATLNKYAKEDRPYREEPKQGNIETYTKIHKQAGVQLESRVEGKLVYQLNPVEELRGLNRLPIPSCGDMYFDIEGDHFYEEGGMEYLFGIYVKEDNKFVYKGYWAKNRREEKKAFADFMNLVMAQWKKYPDFHIYHYAPYEPSAVKRLASRTASYEEEVDKLLRAEIFIDLYSVTKESLIAGVESYSLKNIEQFTGYERKANLHLASDARRRMSVALDFKDFSSMNPIDFDLIELYNMDDCVATYELHEWLEAIYQEQIANGAKLDRPEVKTGDASEAVEEIDAKAQALYHGLVSTLPEDPEEWNNEDKARWLLAHQVEYYRREMKSAWWEFFRLNDMDNDDLLAERKGLGSLQLIGEHPDTKRVKIHTYSYPAQEISLEKGKELFEPKGAKVGTIHDFSLEEKIVHIKKTGTTNNVHPNSLFIKDIVSTQSLVPALHRFAQKSIDIGVNGDGAFRAGRDLLLKNSLRLYPDIKIEQEAGETTEDLTLRLALALNNGVLPVQGPPGTGKTYLGGGLIAELAAQGKKVGVTAVSHKVIRNLLDKALERAKEKGFPIEIKHKGKPDAKDPVIIKTKNEAIAALNTGAVVGGTSWLWAADDFENELDYLFVDEAGQMSLTNVLTISRAAKNIILLGDPQQLEQPQKGTHPENADISALEHILDGHQTMPADRGIFLETTWRLNPNIADYTSKLFYEGRLNARDGLEKQIIEGNSAFNGGGLYLVPVIHEGNQSQSIQEVEKIVEIVKDILSSRLTWTDRENNSFPIGTDDIKIIAPYNAQVSLLKQKIPEIAIGTVDKFQGQEAPIVIYSMTSSSPQDAPRGMSFLYSPNRLNVATSRAKCISILVASPLLFEAECNTIEQMKWANGLCLYKEMATEIN
nr:TM0106 family RecB-like putative nuclease [uncultured Draconibacterium sp.]